MDLILDGLFISNYRAARDLEQLHRNKITHIVKAMLYARPISTNHHYLCIRVRDTTKANIGQYFSTCNDFIHNARLEDSKHNNVLIHCYMGVSRSVSIAIAYIMTVTDLGFDEAWRFMRLLRQCSRPNIQFQQQLHSFEINQLMLERYRLRKRFPNSNLYIADRLRCRAILKDYELLLLERLRFNINNHQVFAAAAAAEDDDEQETNEVPSASSIQPEVSPSKLTLDQKSNQRQNSRRGRHNNLLPSSINLSGDKFEKTVIIPGAILFKGSDLAKPEKIDSEKKSGFQIL